MKNIDLPLSECVAEKASEEINHLKHSIESNKDIQISILQDIMSDMKDQRKQWKKTLISFSMIIIFLVIGIISIGVYNQRILKNLATESIDNFTSFLEKADFYSTAEIVTDNSSQNNGSINMSK